MATATEQAAQGEPVEAAIGSPRRRRAPLWTYACIGVGALLVLASAGLIVAEKVAIRAATSSINKVDVPAIDNDESGRRRVTSITGAKTVLLVGIDPRNLDQPSPDGIRSDSIIMLHIAASHDQAYLVSIPRDTLVEVESYDNGVRHTGLSHVRINAAFSWGSYGKTGKPALAGGLDLLARTIQHNWGITFNAAAIVDFGGFREVVDYIGGVRMYVDEDVKSIHNGTDANGKLVSPAIRQSKDLMHFYSIPGVTPLEYTKGWHDFSGFSALDYCRQRDLMELQDSDYGRQRHQQQFLKAVFKKIVDQYLGSPTKLTGVVNMVGRTMTVSDGGIPLEDWVFAMRGIQGDALVTIKTNKGQFNTTPSGAELISDTSRQLFEAVRTDTVDQFALAHPDWLAS